MGARVSRVRPRLVGRLLDNGFAFLIWFLASALLLLVQLALILVI